MARDKSKMKLTSETRWHRSYELEEPKTFHHESRFADGSAHITMEELAREWPAWSDREKSDFAQEVGLATFPHLPDVLRFIMANGDEQTWSSIALDILHFLPRDESIPFQLAA